MTAFPFSRTGKYTDSNSAHRQILLHLILLLWIHPFLDGNGRVARLFTEAYFHRIPVHEFGLWSASRGLARRNVDYKSTLALADALRRNGLDGRGICPMKDWSNFAASSWRCASTRWNMWGSCGWKSWLSASQEAGRLQESRVLQGPGTAPDDLWQAADYLMFG